MTESKNASDRVMVQGSCLLFHNFGSSISEYVELLRPFMVMYEKITVGTDTMRTVEISDSTYYALDRTIEEAAVGMHKHSYYEFIYVVSGTLHQNIEGRIHTMHPGDCCVCSRYTRHYEITDTDYEIILLSFQEDYLKKLLQSDQIFGSDGKAFSPHRELLRDLLQPASGRSDLYAEKSWLCFRQIRGAHALSSFYPALFNDISLSLRSNSPGSVFFVQGYLCRFLSALEDTSRFEVTRNIEDTAVSEDIFIQASLLIEKSHGRISRQDLEKRLGYSGDYISRIVKHFSGESLIHYEQSYVLREAALLLSSTSLDVTEICARLGYSNRTHFNRIFREHYHASPSEYRKSARKET